MMRFQVALVAVAIMLVVCVVPAAAIVIDDFSVGPLVILGANTTVEQTQVDLDPAHVLGGSRSISFRSFSIPPSMLTIDDVAGTLNVSPGNCCSYLTIRYGSLANPLELDLTADGSDRFVVAFRGITAEIPASLPSILATDHLNRIASILNSNSLAVQPTGPFSITIPFSQFPNFDFANVRSIEITVSRYGGGTGAAGKSFTLDSIATVPEPCAAWAVCIAAGVVWPIRFRIVSRRQSPD